MTHARVRVAYVCAYTHVWRGFARVRVCVRHVGQLVVSEQDLHWTAYYATMYLVGQFSHEPTGFPREAVSGSAGWHQHQGLQPGETVGHESD